MPIQFLPENLHILGGIDCKFVVLANRYRDWSLFGMEHNRFAFRASKNKHFLLP
jgi:hypothetical protein